MSYVAGIDPGKEGHLVIVDPRTNRLVMGYPLPYRKASSTAWIINYQELLPLIAALRNVTHVTIEDVHNGGGNAGDLIKLAKAHGGLVVTAAIAGCTVYTPLANKWKGDMGLTGKPKTASIDLALKLGANGAYIKRNHNIAEAYLLGVYGKDKHDTGHFGG